MPCVMYRLDPLLYYVFSILIVFETAAQEAAPAMISQLEVYSLQDDKHQVVYTENAHFEAPNWSPDGAFLSSTKTAGCILYQD